MLIIIIILLLQKKYEIFSCGFNNYVTLWYLNVYIYMYIYYKVMQVLYLIRLTGRESDETIQKPCLYDKIKLKTSVIYLSLFLFTQILL